MVESKKRNKAQLLEKEMLVWKMSDEGMSGRTIAERLGISHTGVGLILHRVYARVDKQFVKHISHKKALQDGQLTHAVEECFGAWERSKLPKKKAASRTVEGGDGEGGGEVTTSEIVERDGDVQYLYAAATFLRDLRSLHGLDIAPALQDASASVAELVRDMVSRGSEHDKEAAEDQAGHQPGAAQADSGGAGEVQVGPGPIQPDDPVQGTPLEPPA